LSRFLWRIKPVLELWDQLMSHFFCQQLFLKISSFQCVFVFCSFHSEPIWRFFLVFSLAKHFPFFFFLLVCFLVTPVTAPQPDFGPIFGVLAALARLKIFMVFVLFCWAGSPLQLDPPSQVFPHPPTRGYVIAFCFFGFGSLSFSAHELQQFTYARFWF